MYRYLPRLDTGSLRRTEHYNGWLCTTHCTFSIAKNKNERSLRLIFFYEGVQVQLRIGKQVLVVSLYVGSFLQVSSACRPWPVPPGAAYTRTLTSLRLCSIRAQTSNIYQKWSGIRIRVPELIRIRIQMSAGSLPKCCGFINLSASVISPSVVKIGLWLYEKC